MLSNWDKKQCQLKLRLYQIEISNLCLTAVDVIELNDNFILFNMKFTSIRVIIRDMILDNVYNKICDAG